MPAPSERGSLGLQWRTSPSGVEPHCAQEGAWVKSRRHAVSRCVSSDADPCVTLRICGAPVARVTYKEYRDLLPFVHIQGGSSSDGIRTLCLKTTLALSCRITGPNGGRLAPWHPQGKLSYTARMANHSVENWYEWHYRPAIKLLHTDNLLSAAEDPAV